MIGITGESTSPSTRQPIRMSRSSAGVRRPPPTKGQHTAEILAEYGFEDAEIEDFSARGIT